MDIHLAVIVHLALVIASQIPHSRAQCPSGCFGCRATGTTTRVICAGAGLTAFPVLPVDIQRTVEDLTLRSNSITTITASDLANFTTLEMLDLQANRLTTIEPGSFDATVMLQNLILAQNQLTNIPDNLFVNTALTNLDLRQNTVQNISAETFTGVQSLSPTINLEGNVIRRIPDGTFSDLGIIEELDLRNNPFLCDCELRWFPQFLADTRPLILMAGTCNAPASFSGMALDSLTEDQFTCDCIPDCVNGTCDMTVGECVCDDGYIGSDCSIDCIPDCVNGTCDMTVGECVCDDGYIGSDCSIACPSGTYGADCSQNCTCVPEQESSPCDHVDGTCHCLPGYEGSSCELECSEGFYGQDCMEVCRCQNGASCDFITGQCNCTIGYIGRFCSMICPPLRYGQDCAEVCNCLTGNCHHITGECSCPIGFFGMSCDHKEPLKLTPVNSSPRLSGGTVIADFSINREKEQFTATCQLLGQEVIDCTSGNVRYDSVPEGRYVLKLTARASNGERDIVRRKIVVGYDDDYCAVHLINEGVVVLDGQTARVQFQGTRSTISHYLCKVDKQPFIRCRSPYRIENLERGEHKIKIAPVCNSPNQRPYRTTTKFLIE